MHYIESLHQFFLLQQQQQREQVTAGAEKSRLGTLEHSKNKVDPRPSWIGEGSTSLQQMLKVGEME